MKSTLGRLSVALVATVAGCGASVHYSGPPTQQAAGVTLNTSKIRYDGEKLWLEFTVLNNTSKQLVVDRNQIVAKLPDGRQVSRETGSWGAMWADVTYKIPPGVSHALHVEYRVPKDTPTVTLILKGFILDGQPLDLPDYVVTAEAPK